jgi:DNA modification methylase
MTWTIHNGDCLEVLRTLPAASVDAVVTDPPYGLSFMGKRWDYDVPAVEVWQECLRVLKPGGHLLAFAGTRTQHRMAVRIEDAGFEIRDLIAWVYGSGFPKSLDVSKAIDKAAGAEREVIGSYKATGTARNSKHIGAKTHAAIGEYERDVDCIFQTAPATDAARQWSGWGTALKPAMEPITVARKPLAGTVAANVLEHGTGALNVDGCRVAASDGYTKNAVTQGISTARTSYDPRQQRSTFSPSPEGRWPANLIHDGSDETCELLGDAARFFYCAKASKADRDEGLDAFNSKASSSMPGRRNPENAEWDTGNDVTSRFVTNRKNVHPTVKPTDLMRYLCRLVTPPNGTILDPFTGSGSTGKAAMLEGFQFIGIEREAEYCEIARARISKAERDVSKELL